MNFRYFLFGLLLFQIPVHFASAQQEFVVNLAINKFQNSAAKDYPMAVGFGIHYRENVSRRLQLGASIDFFVQKKSEVVKITETVNDPTGKRRLVMVPITFQTAYYLTKAEHNKPYLIADVGFYMMQSKIISKFKALKPEFKPRLGIATGLGYQFMIDESIGFNFCAKYHLIYAKQESFNAFTFQAGFVMNFEGYL
jgi:outer membrane protein W